VARTDLVLVLGGCSMTHTAHSTLAHLWLCGLPALVTLGHIQPPLLWIPFSVQMCRGWEIASQYSSIISFNWSNEYTALCAVLQYVICLSRWKPQHQNINTTDLARVCGLSVYPFCNAASADS
jgi:hypothetical protein